MKNLQARIKSNQNINSDVSFLREKQTKLDSFNETGLERFESILKDPSIHITDLAPGEIEYFGFEKDLASLITRGIKVKKHLENSKITQSSLSLYKRFIWEKQSIKYLNDTRVNPETLETARYNYIVNPSNPNNTISDSKVVYYNDIYYLISSNSIFHGDVASNRKMVIFKSEKPFKKVVTRTGNGWRHTIGFIKFI